MFCNLKYFLYGNQLNICKDDKDANKTANGGETAKSALKQKFRNSTQQALTPLPQGGGAPPEQHVSVPLILYCFVVHKNANVESISTANFEIVNSERLHQSLHL
jgi:hypothetical protein